jgi:hypothetical protein
MVAKTKVRLVIYSPCVSYQTAYVRALGKTVEEMDTVQARVDFLEERMALAADAFETANAAGDTLPVFMGPEWFFRRAEGVYSEAERDEIIEALKAMSRKSFGGLLMVPGTIFWGNQEGSSTGSSRWEVFNCAPVIYDGEEVLRCYKLCENDIRRVEDREKRWGMYNPVTTAGVALGAIPMPSTYEELRSVPPVFNRANVERYAAGLRYQGPGSVPHGNLFTVEGIRFAIDVCRDHGQGILAMRYANDEPEPEPVDVHLTVSSGMEIQPQCVVAREGGYFAICDGNRAGPETNGRYGAAAYRFVRREGGLRPSLRGAWAQTQSEAVAGELAMVRYVTWHEPEPVRRSPEAWEEYFRRIKDYRGTTPEDPPPEAIAKRVAVFREPLDLLRPIDDPAPGPSQPAPKPKEKSKFCLKIECAIL